MFREEFYAALRNDFSAHTTNSFLYRYFKREKEEGFRLKLKQNYMDRKDTAEDRAEYTRVLVDCLLQNTKLQKLYRELDVVFDCLGMSAAAGAAAKRDTEKIKAGLKNLMAEMNSRGEQFPGLSALHMATREILQKTGHSDKRKDIYVQLKEIWMDYRMGELSQGNYLCECIAFLGRNPKLRLSEESGRAIVGLREKLGGEGVCGKLGKGREKYQKLAELIKENQDLMESNHLLEEEEITRMTEEILDSILKMDVKTFLYDIGYSERTAAGAAGESRKKERTMDMLDQYCKEHHISFTPGMAYVGSGTEKLNDPAYIKECRKLFTQLNRDKITRVFIPLGIDSESGAGVYIIGREYYKDAPERQEEIHTSCCYRYLSLEDVVIDDSGTINLVMGEMKMDESLESVVKIFQNQIESHGALEGYQLNNEKAPSDCGALFRIYFDSEEWESELESAIQNNRNLLAREKEEVEKRQAVLRHSSMQRRRQV